MERQSRDTTISSLVQGAILRKGLKFRGQSPLQKKRRGRCYRETLEARTIKAKRYAEDDSGYFDRNELSEQLWHKQHKREEESDQQIFNIVDKKKVVSQDKKVNFQVITMSICIPDFPDLSAHIKEYAKYVKPVLSQIPKNGKQEDPTKNNSDYKFIHENAKYAKPMLLQIPESVVLEDPRKKDGSDKNIKMNTNTNYVKTVLSEITKSIHQEDTLKKDKSFPSALHDTPLELISYNPLKYRRNELVELWLDRYHNKGVDNEAIDQELGDPPSYGSGQYGNVECFDK